MSKYPEYNKVTLDLIEILKSNDLIWIYIIFIEKKGITF
jgi:hypothetical protein